MWLLHAVVQGGMIFDEDKPLIPVKNSPLQIHISELCDNQGRIDEAVEEENEKYALFVGNFLKSKNFFGRDYQGE